MIKYIVFNSLDELTAMLFQLDLFEKMGIVVHNYETIITSTFIGLKVYDNGQQESKEYN